MASGRRKTKEEGTKLGRVKPRPPARAGKSPIKTAVTVKSKAPAAKSTSTSKARATPKSKLPAKGERRPAGAKSVTARHQPTRRSTASATRPRRQARSRVGRGPAAWHRGLVASVGRRIAVPVLLLVAFIGGMAISGGQLPNAVAWLPNAPALVEGPVLVRSVEEGGIAGLQAPLPVDRPTPNDPPGIQRVSFVAPPPPVRPETGTYDANAPISVEEPTRRPTRQPGALDALIGTLAESPVVQGVVEAVPQETIPSDAAEAPPIQQAMVEQAVAETVQTEGARVGADGAIHLASAPVAASRAVPRPGATGGRPQIAIVIDDLGLNHSGTEATLALPGPITAALLPYGNDLARWSAMARGAGHEVIVHMPMQPLDGSIDPGPDALTVGLTPDEITRRVTAAINAVPGAVGLNNHMGSRFTQWSEGMAVVADALRARGLFFLDSRTIPESVAFTVARSAGVPAATRNVFLDHRIDPAFVAQQLRAVEEEARLNGTAIAIGHPHRVTVAALAQWLPTLEARGFDIVPVSALLSR